MHTITVSIHGDVSVAQSVEVDDAEALPLFIKLKSALQPGGVTIPIRRRGRPRKERPCSEIGNTDTPVETEAAEPSEA